MTTPRARVTIGVTGGVACGKSEVGRILERHGVAVCDTDPLARDAIAPGGAAHDAVVARFGAEVRSPDGTLDRARLARIVFSDPTARADLNALIHPVVRRALRVWLAALPPGQDAAALVPLLYEAGWTEEWTAVVCVAASAVTVRARWPRRGWTEEEGRRRSEAQWPLEEKIRRADYVIRNDGTLDELERATLRVLNAIRSQEERHDA